MNRFLASVSVLAIGALAPIGLPRGVNALWNKGGVQYAPPLR